MQPGTVFPLKGHPVELDQGPIHGRDAELLLHPHQPAQPQVARHRGPDPHPDHQVVAHAGSQNFRPDMGVHKGAAENAGVSLALEVEMAPNGGAHPGRLRDAVPPGVLGIGAAHIQAVRALHITLRTGLSQAQADLDVV